MEESFAGGIFPSGCYRRPLECNSHYATPGLLGLSLGSLLLSRAHMHRAWRPCTFNLCKCSVVDGGVVPALSLAQPHHRRLFVHTALHVTTTYYHPSPLPRPKPT